MDKILFNKAFNDYDQLAHEIRAWDLDLYQLDHGEFNAKLLQWKSRKGLLTHAQFNRSFEQRGTSPTGCWTFALLSEHSSQIVWHDKEITENSIVVYRPGTEIDCISKPGFEVYTLSYSEDHLDELGQLIGLPTTRKLANNNDVFYSSFSELAEIRLLIREISQQCSQETSVHPCSLRAYDFESEIPKQILAILSRGQHVPKKISTTLRRQVIKRIKEYLAAYPNEPITIGRLCKIAQVSERTLQYAFKEYFGVTPKTYLSALRLNGVRRQLIKENLSSTKIIDVANFWGFWHMGQFASDYRKFFGELPSNTLKVCQRGMPSCNLTSGNVNLTGILKSEDVS